MDSAINLSALNNKLSGRTLWLGFVGAAFPSHLWGWYNIFLDFGSWVLSESLSDLIGRLAYNIVFIFWEALLVYIVFALLVGVLLRPVFKQQYLSVNFWLVVCSSLFFGSWALQAGWLNQILLGMSLLLVVMIAGCTVLVLIPKVNQVLEQILERISLLMIVYLLVDGIALLVVAVRWLWG